MVDRTGGLNWWKHGSTMRVCSLSHPPYGDANSSSQFHIGGVLYGYSILTCFPDVSVDVSYIHAAVLNPLMLLRMHPRRASIKRLAAYCPAAYCPAYVQNDAASAGAPRLVVPRTHGPSLSGPLRPPNKLLGALAPGVSSFDNISLSSPVLLRSRTFFAISAKAGHPRGGGPV